MNKYAVAEIFKSINGEGKKAGELATFIRLFGCNLNCSWCDTKWSISGDEYRLWDIDEIIERVKQYNCHNITLTGGEPLMQDVYPLLKKLVDLGYEVEIETNGSVSIEKYIELNNVSFTLDYKLPSSGMEDKMLVDNYKFIDRDDVIKFVIGSKEDLEKCYRVVCEYDLINKTNVYLSSVFGKIDLQDIVGFMSDKNWNGVRLQIQMHKIIWEPNMRGV